MDELLKYAEPDGQYQFKTMNKWYCTHPTAPQATPQPRSLQISAVYALASSLAVVARAPPNRRSTRLVRAPRRFRIHQLICKAAAAHAELVRPEDPLNRHDPPPGTSHQHRLKPRAWRAGFPHRAGAPGAGLRSGKPQGCAGSPGSRPAPFRAPSVGPPDLGLVRFPGLMRLQSKLAARPAPLRAPPVALPALGIRRQAQGIRKRSGTARHPPHAASLRARTRGAGYGAPGPPSPPRTYGGTGTGMPPAPRVPS